MSDPLSLARQATISGEKVAHVDGHYILGGQKFHESTKTAFKRTLRISDDYYYSLRDILFFLDHAQLPLGEYRRKALESRIAAIVEQDRGPLSKYLTGAIDSCPQIDVAMQNAYKAAAKPVPAPKKPSAPPAASAPEKPVSSTTESSEAVATSAATATATVEDKEAKDRKHDRKRKAASIDVSDDVAQHGHNLMSQMLASVPTFSKEAIEEDKVHMARLRADEYAANNRHSVMNAQGSDFSLALKLFNDKVLKPLHQATQPGAAAESQPSSAPASSSAIAAAAAAAAGPGRSLIIIVPNSLTALINIFNAQAFLCKGEYHANNNHSVNLHNKPKSVPFTRTVNGKVVSYKIVDDCKLLAQEDWNRVVAAFVTGQQWQLKSYKWSEPRELFQHVAGFHVIVEGNPVDPTVANWNCSVLKVNQFKEHANSAASKDFWQKVDDFVRFRKPGLMN